VHLSECNSWKGCKFYIIVCVCCWCRDAVIISILDTCTAFLAGLVIFATIGFMAAETMSTIDEVVTKGVLLIGWYCLSMMYLVTSALHAGFCFANDINVSVSAVAKRCVGPEFYGVTVIIGQKVSSKDCFTCFRKHEIYCTCRKWAQCTLLLCDVKCPRRCFVTVALLTTRALYQSVHLMHLKA